MVRVLHVIGGLRRAGAETMLVNIHRNIDKGNVKFDYLVYGYQQTEYEPEVLELGAKVIHIDPPNGNYIKLINNIKNVIKKYGPYDVVHVHTLLNSAFGVIAAKMCGVSKIIVHSHSTKNKDNASLIGNLYEIITKRIISKYATDYVACGKEAAEYLFGKDPKKKVNIINNAIDLSNYIYDENKRAKIREQIGINSNLIVGHIGRFHRVKNHEFIIKIFVEILKKEQDAKLILVGDGELRKDIEERVTELGLRQNVIITGVREDVPEIMMAMDALIFPSFYEGLPMTLVEAQATGLPCVVSDTVSQEAKITELVKFVSLEINAEEWANIVIGSIKSNRCSEYYSSLISNSGYEIKGEVKKVEELYYR